MRDDGRCSFDLDQSRPSRAGRRHEDGLTPRVTLPSAGKLHRGRAPRFRVERLVDGSVPALAQDFPELVMG